MIQNPVTVPQAAAKLGISRGRVLQLIWRGKLPAQKLGPDWIIEQADIDKALPRPPRGRTKKSCPLPELLEEIG